MLKNKKNDIYETLTFIKRWARNPFQMGSILPSSEALAAAMARCALDQLLPDDVVLELGPGTGRFTQALLNAGLDPRRLVCMELDPALVHFLKNRFPDLSVIQGNAIFLKDLLPEHAIGRIGVIVSGLPMLSIPRTVQDKIIHACLHVMRPFGSLLQFTYSPFASISKTRYGMIKKHMVRVWANFPPANIFRYTRQEDE